MNEFFRRLLNTEPFSKPHTGDSVDLAVSVDDIHHEQFEQLLCLVEQVRSTGACGIALLGGKNGTGKSHLLARLRGAVIERDSAYLFAVQPVAGDEQSQLQNMASAAVEQLSRDGGGRWRCTPLLQMVRIAVQQAVGELQPRVTPFRVGESLVAFRSLMDRRVNEGRSGHRDVERICSVLFRFLLAAQRQPEWETACPTASLAIRWLGLEPLQPDEGVQLGLRVVRKEGRPTPLVEMPSARSVLIVLAELASLCGRALVACCDPIDECTSKMARALVGSASLLTGRARSLLMIFSGDTAATTELLCAGMVRRPPAGSPCVRKSGVMLGVVSREQSEKVLAARLRPCVEPFLTIPAVRLRWQRDRLFPLGSGWWEARVAGLAEFTLRDVLEWAGQRWRQQLDGLRRNGPDAWMEQFRPAHADAHFTQPADAVAISFVSGVVDVDAGRGATAAVDGEALPVPFAASGGSAVAVWPLRGPAESESAWLSPVNTPASRKPPASPRSNYRFERMLLAATGLLWAATGGALWWRNLPASSRVEAVAERVGTEIAVQVAASVDPGPARIEQNSPQPAVPRQDAVLQRLVARVAAEPLLSAEPAADDSPNAVTMADSPNEAPANAASANATPQTIAAGPVGGVAFTQRPADQVVVPTAVPSIAASGRTFTANSASPSPAVAPVGTLRGPGLAATPTSKTVSAPTQAAGSYVAAGPTPSSGLATGSMSRRGATSGPLRPPPTAVKPIAIVADPQLDRLLTEAWGLIERGDHGLGRLRLLQARKITSEDPRADFSLGLLDGMLENDWRAAEKRFADCVRRDPTNVPSLNNLAIAQVQNRHEAQAAKQWRAIVSQRAATPEVVQSIGHLRTLLAEGKLRANRSLLKTLDDVYTDAAVDTLFSAKPQGGFQLMPLQLPDGRCIGWNDLRKMEFTAPPTPITPERNTTPTIAGRQPNAAGGASAPGFAPAMPASRVMQPNLPDPSIEQTPVYPRYNRTRR